MTGKIVLTIPYILVTIFIFPKIVFGQETQFGYRVSESGKTVIQIARDIYNDERQWKKIAYWNNLTPPYALSVGQVLVLPMPPKIKLFDKNLVAGADVPAPQFLQQLPSVSRVILDRSGYYVYEVNERAPSLSMVALENYGDKNMVKLIARWNGIAANEHLSLGQKLILHEKPILTAAQSNSVLIKEWARVGNGAMVQRLSGNFSVAPASVSDVPKVENHSVAEPTPAKAEAPPATAVAPSLPAVPTAAIPPHPSLPTLPSVPSLPTPSASKASPVEVTEDPVAHGSKKLPEKKVQSVVTEPATLGQPINTMETPTPNVFSPSDDPELQPIYKNTGTSVPTPQSVAPVQPAESAQLTPTSQKPVQQAIQQPAQQPAQQIPQQVTAPQSVQQPSQPSSAPAAAAAAPTAPVPAQVPAQTPAPTAAIPQEPERQPSSTPTDPTQLAEPSSDSYWLGSDTTRIMKTLTKPNGK